MLIDEKTELLSASEAAGLLGVSRRTLSRWARLRKGPPRTKVGRSIFYRRQALEQWLLAIEDRPNT